MWFDVYFSLQSVYIRPVYFPACQRCIHPVYVCSDYRFGLLYNFTLSLACNRTIGLLIVSWLFNRQLLLVGLYILTNWLVYNIYILYHRKSWLLARVVIVCYDRYSLSIETIKKEKSPQVQSKKQSTELSLTPSSLKKVKLPVMFPLCNVVIATSRYCSRVVHVE